MLWQRLLFGTLMIAALAGILILDGFASRSAGSMPVQACAWSAALPLTVVMALIGILASFEMAHVCRAGGHAPVAPWAGFVTAGLMFVPWLEMQARRGSVSPAFASLLQHVSPTVIWIAGGVLGACLLVMGRKTTERALSNIAVTIFIFLYLGLLGSFLVRIRCELPSPAGAALLIYAVITIKAGDIGAYFTGMAIGRHKLCPWLSPGKTIEGAAGAVAGAVLMAVGGMAAWLASPWASTAVFSTSQAIGFGVLMAVTGHLGDLVESAFKRDMKVKDSGQLVPAFGGLLDLLDSPFFAAPLAWLALTFWSHLDYN